MLKINIKGFTLIELLVVISIITILSVVGLVSFQGVSRKAQEAKRRADLDSIKKAYEVNYNPVGDYRPLVDSDFASGKIPTPDGTTATSYFVAGPNFGSTPTTAPNFAICASKSGSSNCAINPNSSDCLCATSTQGQPVDLTTIGVPAALSGLQLWLKADAITGLNDGNAITTWTDSSSAGSNATQATQANKPLYKTNVQNGLPVVRFDGINDSLSAGVAPTNGQTMFLVGKRSSYVQPFGQINGGSYHRGLVGYAYLSYTMFSTYFRNGTSVNPNFGANNMGVISGITSIATSGERSSFILGTGSPSYAPLNGDIAEVIMYSRTLLLDERQSIEQYLSRKYGL